MLQLKPVDFHLLPFAIGSGDRQTQLNTKRHTASITDAAPAFLRYLIKRRRAVGRFGVVRADVEVEFVQDHAHIRYGRAFAQHFPGYFVQVHRRDRCIADVPRNLIGTRLAAQKSKYSRSVENDVTQWESNAE